MYKISLEEKLLIRQIDLPYIKPWGYYIYLLHPTSSPVLIKTENNITDDYKVITLDTATFGSYIDRSFVLEIFDTGSSVKIEWDFFTLSGVISKEAAMLKTIGLLGENVIEDCSDEDAFQDGQAKTSVLTIYETEAMLTERAIFDWERRFSSNFSPDHRYHFYDEKETERP